MKQWFLNIALIFTISLSYAQHEDLNISVSSVNTGDQKNLKAAEKQYKKGTFDDFLLALGTYTYLAEKYPENPVLAYKTGVCYLETYDKQAALPWILKTVEMNPNLTPYLSWNLGRAYFYNHQFEKAKDSFLEFKDYLRGNGASLKKVNDKIHQCEYARELMEQPVNVNISTVKEINSGYPDYCPLITADGSRIFFTSRRPFGNNQETDPDDGLPFEDIWYADKTDNLWQNPVNLGQPVNNEEHNATVGLSADGQKMLIYYDEDLYISKKQGDTWSVPEALPSTINSRQNESSACFSYNQKELFFIRGRKPGNPESNGDIYVSEFVSGRWQEAKKLSSRINSTLDEDGVFMHPDGKTLFFSSKGHNSMGGFDVYKATRNKNGQWSKPVNLGYPVNTAGDDLYFVISADMKSAYYSSYRKDGKGMADIVFLNFETQRTDSIEAPDTVQKSMMALIKGTITDSETGLPLSANIHIYELPSNDSIMNVSSDAENGKYLVPLPSGKNYAMEVNKTSYVFHSENFNLPDSMEYHEEVIDIALQPVKKDVKVVLNNIFFDLDKWELRPESYAELDRLKKLMKDNPGIRIEVSGHTDSQGSYDYNRSLSLRRAGAVREYLIKNGIQDHRITYRGASWDEPIADNTTKEGRQKNRRVEFKIID